MSGSTEDKSAPAASADDNEHEEVGGGSTGRRYGKLKKLVGKGSTKAVYEADDMDTGRRVAWNEVNIKSLSTREIERVMAEIRFLKTLKNDYLIKFFSAFSKDDDRIIFITELMTSGTLHDLIRKYPLTKKTIKELSRDILLGLEYLHTQPKPVIHRDIKCTNIFLANPEGGEGTGKIGRLKIGDLGLATTMACSVNGTPEFMAPEMYDSGYGCSVDIYAFGFCVLEMITRVVPYRECTSLGALFKKVEQRIPPATLEEVRVGWPEAFDFIMQCVHLEPNAEGKYSRPSATTLLQDPFLLPTDDDAVQTNQDVLEIALKDNPEELLRRSTASAMSRRRHGGGVGGHGSEDSASIIGVTSGLSPPDVSGGSAAAAASGVATGRPLPASDASAASGSPLASSDEDTPLGSEDDGAGGVGGGAASRRSERPLPTLPPPHNNNVSTANGGGNGLPPLPASAVPSPNSAAMAQHHGVDAEGGGGGGGVVRGPSTASLDSLGGSFDGTAGSGSGSGQGTADLSHDTSVSPSDSASQNVEVDVVPGDEVSDGAVSATAADAGSGSGPGPSSAEPTHVNDSSLGSTGGDMRGRHGSVESTDGGYAAPAPAPSRATTAATPAGPRGGVTQAQSGDTDDTPGEQSSGGTGAEAVQEPQLDAATWGAAGDDRRRRDSTGTVGMAAPAPSTLIAGESGSGGTPLEAGAGRGDRRHLGVAIDVDHVDDGVPSQPRPVGWGDSGSSLVLPETPSDGRGGGGGYSGGSEQHVGRSGASTRQPSSVASSVPSSRTGTPLGGQAVGGGLTRGPHRTHPHMSSSLSSSVGSGGGAGGTEMPMPRPAAALHAPPQSASHNANPYSFGGMTPNASSSSHPNPFSSAPRASIVPFSSSSQYVMGDRRVDGFSPSNFEKELHELKQFAANTYSEVTHLRGAVDRLTAMMSSMEAMLRSTAHVHATEPSSTKSHTGLPPHTVSPALLHSAVSGSQLSRSTSTPGFVAIPLSSVAGRHHGLASTSASSHPVGSPLQVMAASSHSLPNNTAAPAAQYPATPSSSALPPAQQQLPAMPPTPSVLSAPLPMAFQHQPSTSSAGPASHHATPALTRDPSTANLDDSRLEDDDVDAPAARHNAPSTAHARAGVPPSADLDHVAPPTMARGSSGANSNSNMAALDGGGADDADDADISFEEGMFKSRFDLEQDTGDNQRTLQEFRKLHAAFSNKVIQERGRRERLLKDISEQELHAFQEFEAEKNREQRKSDAADQQWNIDCEALNRLRGEIVGPTLSTHSSPAASSDTVFFGSDPSAMSDPEGKLAGHRQKTFQRRLELLTDRREAEKERHAEEMHKIEEHYNTSITQCAERRRKTQSQFALKLRQLREEYENRFAELLREFRLDKPGRLSAHDFLSLQHHGHEGAPSLDQQQQHHHHYSQSMHHDHMHPHDSDAPPSHEFHSAPVTVAPTPSGIAFTAPPPPRGVATVASSGVGLGGGGVGGGAGTGGAVGSTPIRSVSTTGVPTTTMLGPAPAGLLRQPISTMHDVPGPVATLAQAGFSSGMQATPSGNHLQTPGPFFPPTPWPAPAV